mmetsp:Transcript_42666/g.87072  ORF Transcript_42666/g.87072 Transcript_42666/m.87072 type:complete len:270 (+) Transcript_42666:229-1038(+)
MFTFWANTSSNKHHDLAQPHSCQPRAGQQHRWPGRKVPRVARVARVARSHVARARLVKWGLQLVLFDLLLLCGLWSFSFCGFVLCFRLCRCRLCRCLGILGILGIRRRSRGLGAIRLGLGYSLQGLQGAQGVQGIGCTGAFHTVLVGVLSFRGFSCCGGCCGCGCCCCYCFGSAAASAEPSLETWAILLKMVGQNHLNPFTGRKSLAALVGAANDPHFAAATLLLLRLRHLHRRASCPPLQHLGARHGEGTPQIRWMERNLLVLWTLWS